jgi:hypothetical protein
MENEQKIDEERHVASYQGDIGQRNNSSVPAIQGEVLSQRIQARVLKGMLTRDLLWTMFGSRTEPLWLRAESKHI